ncbi:hypothetical protein JTE90_017265 [Oedothorax gibbosus]|uniref:Uncharacterized protein n=1 Tax=Oedothorax gibbosus TaxID=931172 RepID=A0AAV6VFK7_9ARAC|nr:hypothetical protein JTE90_017265 [Oedothorax gibbosus]
MERIYEIHRAVARGRLRDVQTLLDRKKLSVARDPLGATPLHKAVMYGHTEVAEYIANNFPLCKDAKDLDGRTPLHYAAALKDNHEIYNMLVAYSANPLILDYRGKTAEYYLQFPEHLHLEQMIKQSQRTNANYMANHTNRIKAVASPKRKSPYPVRATMALDFNGNIRPTNPANGEVSDSTEDSETQKTTNHVSQVKFKMPKKTLFRSQPLMPPPKLKRLEVTSANIQRWVRDRDLEKLEGAVLEGYGEKVALQRTDDTRLQQYITDRVPVLVRKIEAIHLAVSNDDLDELQNQLTDTDHMVLAKDRFGMAPLHRAVLMGKPETLAFLIDRFPETLNARDKEGRTALHYAAAMSREPGSSNYFKMLLEAGADARIRDNQGRSPEYYRTHHVPIPHKLHQQQKKQRSKSEPPPAHRPKKLPGIGGGPGGSLPQVTLDKITQWLQTSDVDGLREFVHDGYGQHLVGKTSWNEEVRSYLKTVPTHLMILGSLFHAVERGDLQSLDKQLRGGGEHLLKARDAEGSTLIHHAVRHDQIDVLNYLIDKHPYLMNLKDRSGRTPLHVAGQQKNQYMYTILASSGADQLILDQKGRSAEFYLNSSTKATVKPRVSPVSSTPENDESSAEKVSSTPTPEKEDVPPPPQEDPKETSEKDKENPELLETSAFDGDDDTKKEDTPPNPDEVAKPAEDLSTENTETTPKEEDKGEETVVEKDEPKEKSEIKSEPAKEPTPPEDDNPVSSSGDRLNELIDVWIRDRDLLRLEHVVIAGQGERLIGRKSDHRQVQEFLDLVPTYMARIRGVHDAVVRGNLGEVESVLTRKRFALSRDHLGASPLHLAVLHGHTDIVKYVIDNFPEALDGPDNEGRTPLHYAAVMRDGGTYYRTLLMAGADETVKDKTNHTPDYYLTHTGVLSIRDLLEGYRIQEPPERRPSQVNIWQRPPTDEADKLFDDEELEDDPTAFDPFADVRPGYTPDFSAPEPETPPPPPTDDIPPRGRAPFYPVLFDRQNREGRYLARVLGDALIRGLTQVAKRRPEDPVAHLATYLYQYAARNTGDGSQESSRAKAASSGEKDSSNKTLDQSENNETKTPENLESSNEKTRTPLDVVDEEDSEDFEDEEDDLSLEFEDHTKMKDEEGQTVLHFAASRLHPDGSFRGLLSTAEVLLGERDALYRTCRDVAIDSGQEENAAEIDSFVWDAHMQGRTPFLRMLLHEGYEPLLRIKDAAGRELHAAPQLSRAGAAFLREAADFVKRREELLGNVRNNYLEGVCRLAKGDATLVTAKGTRGRCALHVATLFQNPGIVGALIKANAAAVHVTDNLGRTPLHYAMAVAKVDQIAKILISGGALKNIKDVRMRTPSHFFIYKDEILKLGEEEARLS